MQALVDQGRVAGLATLVARRGQVAHFECYGKLDLAANKAVQPDSLFRIYSLTKPIISVAALMLLEAGCFLLDDPVSKWIPEFKNFKVLPTSTSAGGEPGRLEQDITIRHLLTHTSGMGYGFMAGPIEVAYADAKIFSSILTLQMPLSQLIETITQLPLVAQPGAAWHYSVAHDVIGYLIGLISGQPVEVFLRERIFEPLGMPDTGFYVPAGKLDRFGPLYSGPGEAGLTVLDEVATSPFVRPEANPSGGAGLVATVPDYLRFLLMLANGGELGGVRLLRPDTVRAMLTNQLTGPLLPVRFNDPWPGMGFGLGLGVQVDDVPQAGWPAGAFGWIGVSGTTAWVYPREELIVIAMPQALFNWEASDKFREMAYTAIMD